MKRSVQHNGNQPCSHLSGHSGWSWVCRSSSRWPELSKSHTYAVCSKARKAREAGGGEMQAEGQSHDVARAHKAAGCSVLHLSTIPPSLSVNGQMHAPDAAGPCGGQAPTSAPPRSLHPSCPQTPSTGRLCVPGLRPAIPSPSRLRGGAHHGPGPAKKIRQTPVGPTRQILYTCSPRLRHNKPQGCDPGPVSGFCQPTRSAIQST
jgi:hypothetical protein